MCFRASDRLIIHLNLLESAPLHSWAPVARNMGLLVHWVEPSALWNNGSREALKVPQCPSLREFSVLNKVLCALLYAKLLFYLMKSQREWVSVSEYTWRKVSFLFTSQWGISEGLNLDIKFRHWLAFSTHYTMSCVLPSEPTKKLLARSYNTRHWDFAVNFNMSKTALSKL